MAELVQQITAPNGLVYDQPTGLFINNQWVKSSNGQKLISINPTTGAEIVSVYAATETDVDAAVRAARAAFEGETWQNVVGTSRGALLWKLADLAERDKNVLATIETMDNGKPFSSALGDIAEVYGVLRYYAGWADKYYGQTIETSRTKFTYTVREPKGVCGQIIPWNYPLGMASWKLGPALACGNTIVLKAAEQTPLSILYFANLIVEAGFPPGVVNIINGYGKEAGAALVQRPEVDKVAFTGSTATGKQIMKMASSTLKDITLETGGKSPLIIFEDAQLENAIKWAHYGIMSNMGQICTATSRLFIHEDVYDNFVHGLLDYTARASILGDPFDEKTSHGPQISREQLDKIIAYKNAARSEGATVLTGSDIPDHLRKGYFMAPTLIGNTTTDMTVYREEIFGPLGVLVKFRSEEEVIQMANQTVYGLASALCTSDITRAHRVARKLKAGMVWINYNQASDFRVPFGGVKQSGIGRELGQDALDAYSQTKSIHQNLNLTTSL